MGGTAYLDFSEIKKGTGCATVIFDDVRLIEALSRAWSWTLTGWHRRDVIAYDDRYTVAMSLPGVFAVPYHPHGPHAPFLKALRSGSGKAMDLWPSAWGHTLAKGKWVFFAFTYDGTRSEDNLIALSGTETYPVRRRAARVLSFDGGRLASASTSRLVIGAGGPGSTGHLCGAKIDGLRIYASRNRDSTGALTAEQLKAVRRADVGPAYLKRIASRPDETDTERRGREALYWNQRLSVHQIDSLTSVFPDVPPVLVEDGQTVRVPRNASAPVLFVIRSGDNAECRLHVSRIATAEGTQLMAQVRTYDVRPVPVEANNHGGSNTRAGKPGPDAWRDHTIRTAPFDVSEPLVPTDGIALRKGRYHAVLVDVAVSSSAKPGLYHGTIDLRAGGRSASATFAVQVHATVLPSSPALDTTIWLQPNPECLTSDRPPPWWSERHWQLLAHAGRTLHAYGQRVIATPILLGNHPLIETTRKRDGSYAFDYAKFDRWVELFLSLGFKTIEGRHVTAGGLYALDEATGRKTLVVRRFREARTMELLALFYDSLRQHLQAKGWTSIYMQHHLDEPKDIEWYRRLAAVAKEHLSGVRTIDAIHARRPGDYSPLVDVMALDISRLATHPDIVTARREQGQSTWFYHCCNPLPPLPNRHLDESLTHSRLYPWLAYLLGAEGYLFWAANVYRGADPWRMSVGPGPRGAKPEGYTGHPPGDNWLFYPLADGLTGSMRMVAFRDGLVDHTLLTMLAGRDPAKADAVMRRVARSLFDYERGPDAYHSARRTLLHALEF